MGDTEWMIKINEELNNIDPLVPEWERHSIYKVPLHITKLNKKAYEPRVVSFGPYHHGKKHLKDMEDHKHRALIHFLKRCKKPLDLILRCMDQVVEELRNSYNTLDPIWIHDKHKFSKMMILDGCFMLEIFRTNEDYDTVPHDYAINDPVFGEHGTLYVVPHIKRDMLMLENQIPLMVLRILIQVANDISQAEELLMKQILNFLEERNADRESIGKCMHVLDVLRKSMIQQVPGKQQTVVPNATCVKPWYQWLGKEEQDEEEDEIIRSAIELQEAGIHFKKSETVSLGDVSFAHGVLRLPPLVVDDTTEYMFLNLIAFERLHVGAGNQVSAYVCFMDRMIDTEMDVAILHRKGILINHLDTDNAVAKIFNSLTKEVSLDEGGELDEVKKALSNYYLYKPWKKWRANLIQTYFRSPWASVSLIAAIFLFALTIVQTVYTIVQYYHDLHTSNKN